MELPFEIGKEYDFYGVDNECFKIDDKAIEVLEDADDGYRSYLGSIELRSPDGKIFFGQPLDRVVIKEIDESSRDGYRVLSVSDGHLWLEFGTANNDDYYPCFMFDYSPRAALAQATSAEKEKEP
jgi:hypothetical protein